jgi:hypothetical protein
MKNKAAILLAQEMAEDKAMQEERVRLLQDMHDNRVDRLEYLHTMKVQVVMVCWLLSVVGLAMLEGGVSWH